MKRAIAMWAGLMALWLLLSGHYTPLLIGFGVGSTTFVTWIAMRMRIVDHDSVPLQFLPRVLTYLPWLALEVIKANLHVGRRILSPRLGISPLMSRYRGHEKTDVGRFTYVNSITLTPGTITTGVYGQEVEIHALTRESMDGTEEGSMDRQVTRMEAM